MNEYIEVFRFECLYSKNQLNIERYTKALSLNPCPSYFLHITHLKIYCYFCAVRGRGCVRACDVGGAGLWGTQKE